MHLVSEAGEVSLPNSSVQGSEPVVYVDSIEALAIARGRGLAESDMLRTYSPGLLRELKGKAQQADVRLSPQRIEALNKAATAVSEDLYRWFADAANGGDHHRGVAAGIAVFTLHIPLLKAASLTDADYERPVTVVQTIGGGAAFDATYVSVLPVLLNSNPRLSVIAVGASELLAAADPRPPSAGFRQRMAFAGFSTFVYRMIVRACAATGWPGPRGSILLLRENELVKETALALALRCYTLHPLPDTGFGSADAGEIDVGSVRGAGEAILRAKFAGLIERRPLEALMGLFGESLASQLARYHTSVAVWRSKLDKVARLRPKAVLTNIVMSPEAVGLHRVLGERGIPLVAFQHGVTMEISQASTNYHLSHENCAADLAVMFNDEAMEICERNPFRSGRAVAVGVPKDYSRGGRRRPLSGMPPIWYVATALYLGNRGQLFEGVTDADKAEHEIAIIENVLDRLPHRVLYKPYPAFRYLDPDPIIERARASANLTLYQGRADLRYMIRSARVLVTSRSFSTPSWCLMSGRPVVHIDIPDQTPLRPEAREAFEAGLFLFDAGAPDFHDKLRALLSKPIEEIERLYAEKAMARDELVKRFISTGGPRAGRRAAAAVQALMLSLPRRGGVMPTPQAEQ